MMSVICGKCLKHKSATMGSAMEYSTASWCTCPEPEMIDVSHLPPDQQQRVRLFVKGLSDDQ